MHTVTKTDPKGVTNKRLVNSRLTMFPLSHAEVIIKELRFFEYDEKIAFRKELASICKNFELSQEEFLLRIENYIHHDFTLFEALKELTGEHFYMHILVYLIHNAMLFGHFEKAATIYDMIFQYETIVNALSDNAADLSDNAVDLYVILEENYSEKAFDSFKMAVFLINPDILFKLVEDPEKSAFNP